MTPKISLLLLLFLFVGMLAGSLTPVTAAEDNAEALGAAEDWLALVDAGRYDKSWEGAAGFFKKAVSREKWRKAMLAFRQPLGEKLSRKLLSHTYTTTLPGAPDGEYVVIQYQSSFESKKAAVETVTPMREPDGSWKVSGYFIK